MEDTTVISNGQPEEAWTVVARLHQDPKDPSGVFAREEFHQMSEQIARDNATYGHITIMDMFRKPQFRKRMIAAAVVMAASQLTGNLVIYSNIPERSNQNQAAMLTDTPQATSPSFTRAWV
jgi:hypothetical protein